VTAARAAARQADCSRHASEVIDLYAIKFDPDLVKQYFQQACQLGRDFGRPARGAGQTTAAA
jgi:hypothetical protein